MSNIVSPIQGVFKISIDGREHPNLVVNTGLASIFKDSTIASLCESVSVYNDSDEVVGTLTDLGPAVASSHLYTNTEYGVTGTGTSDYFYMRRTWTFAQGQITGVINKVAVFSDDNTLYAAALLRNAEGEIEPVRPLFAPKVDITYESRWHFKQGDSYTQGTPVFFGGAGMVTVKSNIADKNDPSSYENMNKPFKVLSAELFSDTITEDHLHPVNSLGVLDPEDLTVSHILGDFGVYGQIVTVTLPETKYINDLPIATMVLTTTRGHWQIGFDAPLEKPTLSKRFIEIKFPFIHGTLSAEGLPVATGNPDALTSIFSELDNATFNLSLNQLSYTGVGEIATGIAGFSGKFKDTARRISIAVPETETLILAFGETDNLQGYLDVTSSDIVLEVKAGMPVTGYVNGVAIEGDTITFAAGDPLIATVVGGRVTLRLTYEQTGYITANAVGFADKPTHSFVGVKDVTASSKIIII